MLGRLISLLATIFIFMQPSNSGCGLRPIGLGVSDFVRSCSSSSFGLFLSRFLFLGVLFLVFLVSDVSGSARGWETKYNYKGFGIWRLSLWGNSLNCSPPTPGSWRTDMALPVAFPVAYGIPPLVLYSWSASHAFLPRRRDIDRGTAPFCIMIMTGVSPMSRVFSVTQTMGLAMCSMAQTVSKMNSAVHKLVSLYSYYTDAAFAGQSVTTSPSSLYGSSLSLLSRRGAFVCSCVSLLTPFCRTEQPLAPGRKKKSGCEAWCCCHYFGSHGPICRTGERLPRGFLSPI
jgi:hypothetical protein